MFNACRNIYTYIHIYIYIFITIIYLFIYLFIYLRSVVHQWNGAYFELDVLKFTITQPLFHGSWVKCSPAKSQWVKMLRGMCCKYIYIYMYMYLCIHLSIHLSIYRSIFLSAETNQQNSGAHFVMSSSAEKNFFQQKSWGQTLNQQKSTTQNVKMSSAQT